MGPGFGGSDQLPRRWGAWSLEIALWVLLGIGQYGKAAKLMPETVGGRAAADTVPGSGPGA